MARHRMMARAIIWLGALALCACSENDLEALSNDDGVTPGLFITYTTADQITNYYTRSYSDITNSAWTDSPWYENNISRLDLFVFEAGNDGAYSLKQHFAQEAETGNYLSGEWQLLDTDNNTPIDYNWVSDTDSLYLIGNYFTDETADKISSPSDIQTLYTEYADDESPHGPRSSFVFAARQAGSTAISSGSTTQDSYGNNIYRKLASFTLERTVAKVCIYIYYKGLDENSYSLLTNFSDKDITLQVVNYAASGCITENGVYPLTETVTTTTQDTITTYAYSYKHNVELESEDSAPSSETYYTDSSNDVCAVIYLYPNDWLDMNKVPNVRYEQPILYEDIDGDGTEEATNTYIQMNVAFTHNNHTKNYEYQVPLNYLLPSDNDEEKYLSPETMDEDDLTTLKDYYRVLRNHIYVVAVYIHEQDSGLTVSVGSSSSIEDLDDGGSITID